MRITYDLIQRSPVFLNPVKDREIDLRGNKISVIENLGTTQDQFDTIDLSDNEIKKVENFPLLTRLKTLFFNNNQISKIASLGDVLPYLDTLILTNNKLTSLSDLDPLATLGNLRTLSLLENPVSLKNNYRLYVIHLLPKLRLLDFRKVKQKEREDAVKLFGVYDVKTKTSTAGETTAAASEWTKEQSKAISDAITTTTSLDELNRLETALAMGQVFPQPNGS
eukprot:TRINITY_DN8185_c0_g1_i2.p1 TRINITY_DN8185_c0_g1~~TRINITY_DN8185_c0_g1_i2.p1  ORF type:complete len:223 (-),score=66.79 TRINITY_DN8185_c0_g1_i2:61-729(-)